MSTDPEVCTAAGTVRGTRHGAVAAFRGVPYAQPPVGTLRLRAPVPAKPWDGVRDASTFGPPVPQQSSPLDASDDWLTVNVWAPDLGAAGLPVMVWIHGGAYLHGSSASPHHDGAALAAGGAVVVSLNYRLGVEGFAHLTGAPDNRGILDQILALRWVQENIAAFGGDPANVTVFGQSAGAGSVAALLAMPAAAGLFRRAIAQSVPGTFFTSRLAADVSTAIASSVGVEATAAGLARIPSSELVRVTQAVVRSLPRRVRTWGPMATTPTPFSPVVDGDTLPRSPWAALAAGAGRGVDLLVGHTRDEYRGLAARRGGEITDVQATATLDKLVPGGSTAYRAAYPEAGPAQLHELVNSDWLMRMPSLQLADAQQAGGGPAWTYELRWGPGPDGAAHSLDVRLVFGSIDVHALRSTFGAAVADEAVHLSEVMRADWLRFAATGDPGWPRCAPPERPTRVYDAEPSVQPYPEERSRRIWQEHPFDTQDLLATSSSLLG
ncbi:carboxylesterase/lipase family protein [Pseudonocardia adelaidensis]|uniref:Carboxylic ester hydrolase n=1 Tax=Pseudonocardia adelaidensis TaxID=648754 RepID=A0ABP9NKE1_9PSEU